MSRKKPKDEMRRRMKNKENTALVGVWLRLEVFSGAL
jgi:hypothetical protein